MNEDEPYSPEQIRSVDAGDIYLQDNDDGDNDGDFHDVHIAPAPSKLLKPEAEDNQNEFSSVALSVARNKHDDEEESSISEENQSAISSSSNLDSQASEDPDHQDRLQLISEQVRDQGL